MDDPLDIGHRPGIELIEIAGARHSAAEVAISQAAKDRYHLA